MGPAHHHLPVHDQCLQERGEVSKVSQDRSTAKFFRHGNRQEAPCFRMDPSSQPLCRLEFSVFGFSRTYLLLRLSSWYEKLLEAGSNSIFCNKIFLAEAANSLPSSPSSAESFRPDFRASFSLSTMGMVCHHGVARVALLTRELCSTGQHKKKNKLAA